MYGEGKEQQPLALITDAPVEFVKKINKKELIIDPKEDLYLPLFSEYIKEMKKGTEKATKHKRPSWDEYFLQLIEMVGSRGTCDRGRAGSVIVKNKRILSTGYVGAPAGLPSCDDVGHEMHTVINEDGTESRHCIRTSHAEQNAINNAARIGVAIEGGTVYCKMTPLL